MFFFESVEHMVAYRPSLVFPRAMVVMRKVEKSQL